MKSIRRFKPLGFILCFCFGLMFATPSWAEIDCGDTIEPGEVAKLSKNLNCPAHDPVLKVIGPATLDMRGYTVNCQDSPHNGIVLEGEKAILKGGTVTGCQDGVRGEGIGNHRIVGMKATKNSSSGFEFFVDGNKILFSRSTKNEGTGFFFADSGGNTVLANSSNENRQGFFFIGDDSIVKYNTARNNGFDSMGGNDDGFDIVGSGYQFSFNIATGNDGRGFQLQSGDRNKFYKNTASRNIEVGIFLGPGINNTAVKNTVKSNGESGIEIQSGGTNYTIKGNLAIGNARDNEGFDLEDNNEECDENIWKFNIFKTRNQPCVR